MISHLRILRFVTIGGVALFQILPVAGRAEDLTWADEAGQDPMRLLEVLFGRIANFDTFTWFEFFVFTCIVMTGFEGINYVARHSDSFINWKPVPVRGKHLDDLSLKDLAFITFSKVCVPPFFYLYMRYGYFAEKVIWNIGQANILNTILPLPVIFVVYDFGYTILHWFLHIQSIYGFIHKHHHQQKAPSRANVDAINVHPIEFFLGEYNHLLAFFVSSQFLEIHIIGALLFLSVGGTMTAFNHTRFDVVVAPFGFVLYDSKAHDVHHRIPQSNYGQYTNFWDHVFGTFRPYSKDDRVNPKAQLDPTTGKTIGHVKTQ